MKSGIFFIILAALGAAFFLVEPAQARMFGVPCTNDRSGNYAYIEQLEISGDMVRYQFDASTCKGYKLIDACEWQIVNGFRSTVGGRDCAPFEAEFPKDKNLKVLLFPWAGGALVDLPETFQIGRARPIPPAGTCPNGVSDCDLSKGERCVNNQCVAGGGPAASPQTCDPSDSQACGLSSICDPAKKVCVAKNEATTNYDPGGLVPCTTNCDFCDLFTLVERSVKRLFMQVVPAIAVIIVVIAGLLLITSAGDEGRRKTANGLLVNVIVGLAIIYSAWLVVHTVLSLVMGPPAGSPDVAKIVLPWHEIECKLGQSSTSSNPLPPPPPPTP